jgi:predicted phosphodiesterase
MKIAHLSDLHFASWDWNVSQLFSKRWLGNLNFLFGRRKQFEHQRLKLLPPRLKSLDVSTVIITGDLSTTSAPAEFQAAKIFIESIEKHDIEVLCVPGNHDHYTRASYKQRHFYDYFASCWGVGSLKDEGVSAKKLCDGWWIVGLDTALATSWLQNLPAGDQVLLVNHFPFFQHESPRKQLVRGLALQTLIEKHPQIKIYCHGHTHRQCRAALQESGLPLILDPGSTTYRKNGGWYLIDLPSTLVERYELV